MQGRYGVDSLSRFLSVLLLVFIALGLFVRIPFSGMITFVILRKTTGLRVSPEEELKGLDITEHGNDAYAGFQIFTNE